MNPDTILDKGTPKWPDTYLGSEEYYSIDCGPYLLSENDELDGEPKWVLPAEITSLDEVVVGNECFIKIKAATVGIHTIRFSINTIEGLSTQIVKEKVKLEVFDF